MIPPEDQKKILSIIPHVTAMFSIFGSAFIISEIIRERKKWKNPYHRILFSMCVIDLMSSLAVGLSTWPIPRDSPGVYAAKGTIRTCEVQGFFVQVNISSPIYNFVLSVYFLLRVKYNMTERQISYRIEPVMQASTMFFAISTSFICLGLGFFNDSTLWCWTNAIPKGCHQSFKHGTTTCERGDNAEIFRWAFYFGPLWACVLGSWVVMGMLYRTVNVQEKKAAAWRFGENQDSRRHFRKSRMVARQAFRYLAVFYLTWVAGTINRLVELFLGHSFFWISVFHAFFTPMQGFFNFLVYKYPDYKKWRKAKQSTYSTNISTQSRDTTIFSNHATFAMQWFGKKSGSCENGLKSKTGGGIDKPESTSTQESPKLRNALLKKIVAVDAEINEEIKANFEDGNQCDADSINSSDNRENYQKDLNNKLNNEKLPFLDPGIQVKCCSMKHGVGVMNFETLDKGDKSGNSDDVTYDHGNPSNDEGMNPEWIEQQDTTKLSEEHRTTPSFFEPIDLYFV